MEFAAKSDERITIIGIMVQVNADETPTMGTEVIRNAIRIDVNAVGWSLLSERVHRRIQGTSGTLISHHTCEAPYAPKLSNGDIGECRRPKFYRSRRICVSANGSLMTKVSVNASRLQQRSSGRKCYILGRWESPELDEHSQMCIRSYFAIKINLIGYVSQMRT